jgi:hypothetical protein
MTFGKTELMLRVFVGGRTGDRFEDPGVKITPDHVIFNNSTGKSVSYAHTAHVGQEKHIKSKSLLHLTSKG